VRTAVLLALTLIATGCGGGNHESPPPHAARTPLARCTHASGGFRACTVFRAPGERSALYRRSGSEWVVLRGRLSGRAGWWRRVVASPDRRILLAQWSGECEVQSTYLVSASDGSLRPVFSGLDSDAVGWTAAGLARVRLVEQEWRGKTLRHRAGTYLVDPRTMTVMLERAYGARTGC
jgi:hypothetical protein